jgi:hypothetical protein
LGGEIQMEEIEKTNQNSVLFKFINFWKEMLLPTAGLVYILGYIVWSVRAYHNNLGLLPLVDAQYLVAGFFPFLLLVVLIVVLQKVWLIKVKIGTELDQNAKGMKKIVRWGLFASAFFGVILMSLLIYTETRVSSNMQIGLIVVAWGLFILGFMFLPPIGIPQEFIERNFPYESKSTIRRYLRKEIINFFNYLGIGMKTYSTYSLITFIVVAVVVTLGGINSYINQLHPHLSQEFGGSKPRCAQLDISVNKLSPEMKEILFDTSIDETLEVAQTKNLLVFFSGSNFMMVKSSPDNAEIYEIKNSIVNAIYWCR